MNKSPIAGGALIALLGFGAAAQAQDDFAARVPAAIQDAGKLSVGTSPTYPPLEFKDPMTMGLQGLDIDLTEEIGRRLGLEIDWQEQSFDQLINSLNTDRIQMGASGMTDIPARRETVDFVDYFSTGSQLFTLQGTADELQHSEDACGKPVAVNRNGIFFTRLKEFNEAVCIAKGLGEVQYVLVDKTADARLQLIQGRAVAAVQGVDAIRYLNEHEGSADKGKFRLVGEPIAVDYAGFGFHKSNAELRDLVADVVDSMIEDGTYTQIFAKWELAYAEMETTLINAEPRN